MIFSKKTILGALAALLCFTSNCDAADQKIGIVNFKTVVEESKLGKQEQSSFESMKKQMEQVLEEKEKTLNEIATKFNDPDYMDSLSNEAEAELKHKFRTMSQEMNALQGQYYQALNQANYKIVQKVSEDVAKAADTVARQKGLDLVLNDESAFFHSPALDISKEVVKILDQNFEKQAKEKS